ncbi:MAG: aldo/keto reductase [Clostridiales bacterium]|nr:aldo/keto reductase [Clostridiales bacterium]
MQYRVDKKSGNKLSALGLGCMRFPPVGQEAERVILAAINGGVNYFDTAYIYPNSEKTLGSVLKKHNLRESVFIATKMPISMCKKYEDFDRFFDEQLRRLQTDFVDYYLMHNVLSFSQWETIRNLGIEKWIAQKKETGQIKHVGFSFHGSGDDFPKMLDTYDWEFCLIQYNYYDENYQAGKNGLRLAAEKGLSVMVMEPLLGGRLATGLPKKAVDVFAKANPEKTPANWALDWLWNHPEITVVLSGMSSAKIAEENIRAATKFIPFEENELAVFSDVKNIFAESFKVKCTGCNYCLPCPKDINIPARFAAYNASYAQNYFAGVFMYFVGMGAISPNPISIRSCTSCGKCEKACPQNIPIRTEFKKVARRFESLPMRAALKMLRLFKNG